MKRDNCNGEMFGAENLIGYDEKEYLEKNKLHSSEMAR